MKIVWEGVFPAVTTKFKRDFSLDLAGFQNNIQAQIEAGVHGIVLGGTLGEASTLDDHEKGILLEAAREVSEAKVPIIVNIAAQTTESAIKMVQDLEKQNVDGFMLLPPMRYPADDREALEYLKKVAGSTGLPVMIYNNPIDYRILVTLDMFEELAALPNVQAVKESTRDVTNLTRMINRFGDRFSLLCGVDTIAVESLFMGANGWVAGLVCAFPKETVVIYKLMKNGRYAEALEIFRWFLPLLELDIHPKLVQYIKLAESLTGLGTETTRPPRLSIIDPERSEITRLITKAIENRPVLPSV